MKQFISIKKYLYFLISLQLISIFSFAQNIYSFKDNTSITINGTSSLHDWEMKATKANCTATIIFNSDGSIKSITAISFSAAVQNFNSEHSGMDKTAYKSLKSSISPNVFFNATNASLTSPNKKNYLVNCAGKLTIAGVTKDIQLQANLILNNDNNISLNGTKNINMMDYGIEPPTAFFGTIKTGKDVVVKINATLKK